MKTQISDTQPGRAPSKSTGPSRQACYMLRRNLPLWKAAEVIAETIQFCKDVGISEIIWKIDAEEFNHGFTPLDMIREYLVWLERAKKAQLRESIGFSINPWLTQNHIGRARYRSGPPPGFHWRIGPSGSQVSEMACPLSEGWQEWLLEAYKLYATLEPEKLWLEDDFKTFSYECYNLGCYCPDHLRLFSNRIGSELTRDELVECILRPGAPDPTRGQWFDFQGEILVDICRKLERAVHDISPNTRLGQMLSWSTDGRWWADSVTALAGSLRPLTRSSLAPYQETITTDFLPDAFDMLKEMACLPQNTENCPELENSTYSPYSKSTRLTRLQILVSQVLGHPAVTMNLFDMVGSPISDDPRIGRMLKDLKPFINGIADGFREGGVAKGVSVIFPKRYADTLHLRQGQGYESLVFDGEGWCIPLQGSGVPVVMNADSDVYAITGQVLRSLDGAEIERLLSRGVLLDGSAAAVLQDLGYGERIGVKVGTVQDRQDLLLSAERDDWANVSAAGNPVYLSLRRIANPGMGRLYPLTALNGAESVSVFVDPDHQTVMPGMVIFENDLGGRVAIYPFDLSLGPTRGFMNWGRRMQLQKIIRWLGRGKVSLLVDGGAWMMPVRRDYEGHTLIAVVNFEMDDWEETVLTFDFSADIDGIVFQRLTAAGEFENVLPSSLRREGDSISASFHSTVTALDAAVWRVLELPC